MSDFLSQLSALLPLATKWVEEVEANILQTGTPLSAQGLADAKAVGVLYPENIRVAFGTSMPVPSNPELLQAGRATGLLSPDTRGMAFRYGIFIRHDFREDRSLLAHECTHTGQYERLGGIAQFLAEYLTQCVTIGYPAAPMEQEAIHKAANLA